MFSLSTFSSKSKESSTGSTHAFNKPTYHHQPISLSGLPMTSIGNPSMSQSTDFSSNGKMSKNEHKFPLLNSSGIAPTLMTPSNFRVTRRVGSDSLLVAWTTPDDDDITGYLVRTVLNINMIIAIKHYHCRIRYQQIVSNNDLL